MQKFQKSMPKQIKSNSESTNKIDTNLETTSKFYMKWEPKKQMKM